MKLNYFDLISPEPVYLNNVGGIVSPILRDISRIGIGTYNYYLSVLAMDIKLYFESINMISKYDELPDFEKSTLDIFDLLIGHERYRVLLLCIFNFFIKENVSYSKEYNCFFVLDTSLDDTEPKIVGWITRDNYHDICNVIFQRNNVNFNQDDSDIKKAKNKRALEILKKIQKGREQMKKTKKQDKRMELGNIISSVANKSPSINMLNIWELTVYQVWDSFSRLTNNTVYDIQSTSVAVWGDKENHFDTSAWFKRIDDKT